MKAETQILLDTIKEKAIEKYGPSNWKVLISRDTGVCIKNIYSTFSGARPVGLHIIQRMTNALDLRITIN